ncbi:MAG TPA: mobile mystery protein B [Bacteroidia bacterium]|nr:mobile mystery protein B [Bacteroidia bacterium]
MGLTIQYAEGQTPLSEEEKDGLLIHSVTTHGELNEFEQMNIEKAVEWTLSKTFRPEYILSEDFVRKLHRRMFDEVWSWAGEFRLSEKNLGIPARLIGTTLRQLNDDCLFWVKNKIYSADEIAIRYKHRIVSIHCFSNGNGRHSRLIADVIHKHIFNLNFFNWSDHSNLEQAGEQRTRYLQAIREADRENIQALIEFAKS